MSDFEMPNKKKPDEAKAEMKEINQENSTEKEETKKPKWTPEELLQVFDTMIFEGSYTEVVDIRGKLKVAFRTRNADEVESISLKLDTTSVNLMATLMEKRSLLNLHYALVAYQGKDLSMMKLEEKAAFINKLPSPIIGALITKLSEFDQKVYDACKEGEENF